MRNKIEENEKQLFRLAADQNSTVESWITSGGKLITTRYEADFEHGQVQLRSIPPQTRVVFLSSALSMATPPKALSL